MKVFAHRGASGTEPENTIRSFQKAQSTSIDMIELDVRESKDGEIVVIHDHDLLRLYGDPRRIKDMTLTEIKRVSIEHGREVPTLDEALVVIGTDLNIEIKVHGIEEKVLSKIKNFPHKVLISSFYPGVVKKIRALDGKIPLGLNFLQRELGIKSLFGFLTRKIDLTSIHIQNKYVTWASVGLARLLAPKVYVWTVNSKEDYIRMRNAGVDGIFTDYPELIKQYE